MLSFPRKRPPGYAIFRPSQAKPGHDQPHRRKSTVDNILAGASRAALLDDQDDDLLVIQVDELREIVESHL